MLYPALLFVIEFILFLTNYIPGTYLMGWDNVMPEFNLWLNFKRSLFGVWQEYRGLGLLDGLSHSASLLHTLYISLLSIVFPQSMLRYVFILLTHFLGGLAFFYLTKRLTKNEKTAFIGALFYMFCLGIVQIFFAPLEVFAFHFVALPLLALFVSKALEKPGMKNYLLLLLVSFLTTPQGFVPTIFFVFSLLFLSILFFYIKSTKQIKTALVVFLIVLAANSFWLLPYLYSIPQISKVIPQTRINRFSSEELFYRNKAFGNLENVLKLKGFMMDAVEYNQFERKNEYFLQKWRDYQKGIFYNASYYLLLGVGLLGLATVIKNRKKEFYPYVLSLIFSFSALANNTLILGRINDFLRSLSPVFSEVLRIPFTKFIILLAFCLSIFLSQGLNVILARLDKFKNYLILVVFIALFYITLPSFQGFFLSPILKVKLPEDYLKTMKYLDSKNENQRIALLPAFTFWNWQYRTWGYRGSGFLWYGIKQPLMERAFDPWSLYNEKFYNELSYSMNSADINLFKKTLLKYDIAYLLIDGYLLNNVSTKPINYTALSRFLAQANFLKKEVKFGRIVLFKNTLATSWATSSNDFSEFSSTHPFGTYFDESNLRKNSSVISQEGRKTNVNLPALKLKGDYKLFLPSLFQSEGLIPVRFTLANNKIILNPLYPEIYLDNQKVQTPGEIITLTPKFVFSPKKITLTDTDQQIVPGQIAYIRNKYLNTIKLENGLNQELLTFDTRTYSPNQRALKAEVKDPQNLKAVASNYASPFSFDNLIQKGEYEIKTPFVDITELKREDSFVKIDNKKTSDSVDLKTRGDSIELVVWKDNLPHDADYTALIETKYISGLPITLYIDNPYEKRAEFETRLSKESEKNIIFLPRTQKYFQGYGVHLVVKSLGSEIAESAIKTISLYPYPLETLKNIQLIKVETTNNPAGQIDLPFKKTGYFTYDLPSSTFGSYISLSQAFDPGWKAYQDGKELRNHVLVNNWANGWRLEAGNSNLEARNNQASNFQPPTSIVIVFWPQYLEFLGFILLFGSFIWIIFWANGEKSDYKS